MCVHGQASNCVCCIAWLAETYKVSMWMRKFQSFTWKRTWLWSSSDRIYRLDLGPLTQEEKENSARTVTRTMKDGKECWTANDNLKPTQLPGLIYPS